uniref:Right handed beta helix domain-containing protein n=1 Tax=Amphimedon queenslandica TaxID=400682 RepID=A0A1X7UYQ9_AMPQE
MIILVSHCDIHKGKNCTNLADILTNHTQYNIESVTFEGNNVGKLDKVYESMLSYGGGLNILLAWSSCAQSISILNTNFTNNTAFSGGGFGLILRDNTSNNHILVQNSNFEQNKVHINNHAGGGGLKLTLHAGEKSQPGPSNIKFNSCVFSGNKAFFGGGMALKIAGSELSTINQSSISFKRACAEYNHCSTLRDHCYSTEHEHGYKTGVGCPVN